MHSEVWCTALLSAAPAASPPHLERTEHAHRRRRRQHQAALRVRIHGEVALQRGAGAEFFGINRSCSGQPGCRGLACFTWGRAADPSGMGTMLLCTRLGSRLSGLFCPLNPSTRSDCSP